MPIEVTFRDEYGRESSTPPSYRKCQYCDIKLPELDMVHHQTMSSSCLASRNAEQAWHRGLGRCPGWASKCFLDIVGVEHLSLFTTYIFTSGRMGREMWASQHITRLLDQLGQVSPTALTRRCLTMFQYGTAIERDAAVAMALMAEEKRTRER